MDLIGRLDRLKGAFTELQVSSGVAPRAIPSFLSNVRRIPDETILSSDENTTPEIEWNKYYKLLPHHRRTIDVLNQFYNERLQAMKNQNLGWSIAINNAIQEKLTEMEKDSTMYTQNVVKKIEGELTLKRDLLVEKQRFLTEEKISHLLEEHPEWAEVIIDDIKHSRFTLPTDGTALEEE